MSLHRSAEATVRQDESTRVAQASPRAATPRTETLFDAIQVCEISLSVASRHQFEAWVRGPLNSLVPHSGLVVWTQGPDGGTSAPAALEVDSSGLRQPKWQDSARFASDLRRRWRLAGRAPILLDTQNAGLDAIPEVPSGSQMLVHGIEPLFGGPDSLFAVFCDKLEDHAHVLFLAQLIAPYLHLAVDRIDRTAETPGSSSPLGSIPTQPMGLSARETGILECIRDGKTNAEIGTALHISPFTVKSHLQRVFRKLDVSTRTQAVATALSLRIIEAGRQRTACFKRKL